VLNHHSTIDETEITHPTVQTLPDPHKSNLETGIKRIKAQPFVIQGVSSLRDQTAKISQEITQVKQHYETTKI
jgi:hypothetical protein